MLERPPHSADLDALELWSKLPRLNVEIFERFYGLVASKLLDFDKHIFKVWS